MKIKINFWMLIILIFVAFALVFLVFFFTLRGSDTYCNTIIENEKVIFAFSNSCPHCRAIEPIMEKRNDTYWLNVGSAKCQKVAEDLGLYITNIPTFICTKNTSAFTVGEQSEESFNSWIEENC